MYREVGRGIAVGLLGVGYGLWLTWRGIRNDIWCSHFGEPIVPRWMYIGGGILIVGLSVGFVIFVGHVGSG